MWDVGCGMWDVGWLINAVSQIATAQSYESRETGATAISASTSTIIFPLTATEKLPSHETYLAT